MTRKFVGFALAALAVTVVACDGSKKELEKTVAQMQQISAEKDSLLKDVMSTSQFIADVNTELAKVKSRSAGKPVAGQAGELESNMTPAQQREAIKAKLAELTQRLNESESRLAASRNRVRDLTANNAQLSSQMAAYDSTIASFKTIIDNQKTEIASLTEQINALQAENTTLKAEKATLTQQLLAFGRKSERHSTLVDLNQVTVRKLDKALGSSPAALLAGSNEIEKSYDLTNLGPQEGLDWLDAESARRFHKDFADLTESQKCAIADDICGKTAVKKEFKSAQNFFNRFRYLAASGYYTTPQGWKDIGYTGNVPTVDFAGPTPEALKHLGLA